MNIFHSSLVFSVIFLLFDSFNGLNARIVDTNENEKIAEIYSSVELECRFNSVEVNWRKLNGVKKKMKEIFNFFQHY